MKGWKERACAALKNARLWAGGDIRTEALNLIAEYEARRAEKRKAREAEAVPHLVGESWVKIKQEEARSFSESQVPQPAPLSGEYLDTWVPRMEAMAKYDDDPDRSPCDMLPGWKCTTCICHEAHKLADGGLAAGCKNASIAFLSRPDVVAWKERQKWPKWVTVMTPDGNVPNARRLVACYSQGDWDSFLSPALATAAEIDAVMRP
jgi:hypothetical protein